MVDKAWGPTQPATRATLPNSSPLSAGHGAQCTRKKLYSPGMHPIVVGSFWQHYTPTCMEPADNWPSAVGWAQVGWMGFFGSSHLEARKVYVCGERWGGGNKHLL